MSATLAMLVLCVSFNGPAADDPGAEGKACDLAAKAGPDLKGTARVSIPPGKEVSEKSPWSYDPKTGVLVCRGDEAGHEWLRFDGEQGDGVYHVEWRFTPVEGKQGYNSGVLVRNSEDGRFWHQAQTGAGEAGYLFGETLTAGKPKFVRLHESMLAHTEKPPGEWNTYEITCEGPKLTLKVNGETTSVWEGVDVPKGYLGLEAEGFRIEFRKVLWTPLP